MVSISARNDVDVTVIDDTLQPHAARFYIPPTISILS